MAILSPIHNAFRTLSHNARPRTIRPIRQFLEQEFTIAKGKLRGTRWRADTSPFQGLLLDQLKHLQIHESAKRRWREFAFTGCVQSGKSLIAFVGIIMYHLFEIGEDVIAMVPTVDEIGRDKWRKELLPAIQASRYARFLPTTGPGSQGGFGSEITFTHGVSLKWMSGSGGDEKRSSYTARVLVVTEADKMDQAGDASREADPITQGKGRLASYLPEERLVYLECTVSIEEGAIWRTYSNGSASKIVKQCPHCKEWVCPEREQVRGYDKATNEFEAERDGYIVCPACETPITEAERRVMCRGARLLHKGQEIDADGNVTGELPPTYTLGFRWNAFDNFAQLTIAGMALEEWQITEAENEQSAIKAICQYMWATPYKPPVLDLQPLRFSAVRERFAGCTKDQVPDDAECVVGAIDCGKSFLHWGVCAYRPEARGVLVAYGRWENPPCEGDEAMHVEAAILAGLESLRDQVLLAGFPSPNGQISMPQQVLVDAGYMPNAVYTFALQEDSLGRFRATIGRGSTQTDKRLRTYRAPKKTSAEICHIGDEYHLVWDQKRGDFRCESNADYWKVQLFRALQAPVGAPGSLGFFQSSNPKEHNTLAKHLTAERPYEAFEPGKGRVTKWLVVSDTNHYLDVCYMCCVAGHLCGVRLIESVPASAGQTEVVGSVVTTADGRPYLAVERS